MLACVIYQEAGGDATCDECRYRVADVVLNRVADSRFPNTMYEVLTAPRQYGRFHWTGIVWPSRASAETEKHAVERAYKVAEEVLNGRHSELYGQGYIWQAEFVQGTDGFWCCGHFYGR
jgi:spore germination cell wall hydrolase CwlJ-like protein